MKESFPLVYPIWIDQLSIGGFYDGYSNIFIRTMKDEYDILTQIKSMTKTFPLSKKTDIQSFLTKYNQLGLIKNKPKKMRVDCSTESIENLITYANERANPRKLTVEITQNCNLRCKYCNYTVNEKLQKGRYHNELQININDAKKGIKNYISDYAKIISKLPLNLQLDFEKKNPPTIGFYGGEVLTSRKILETLITFSILEGNKSNLNVRCVVTTNGTLLDEEIIDFLVNNNVFIAISLDGPMHENDKNRVFKNGTGSFTYVEKALLLIREKYPHYSEEMVSIQAVDAPNYNKKLVEDYFSKLSTNGYFAGVNSFLLLEFNDPIPVETSIDISDFKQQIDRVFSQILDFFDSIDPCSTSKEIINKINNNLYIKSAIRLAFEMNYKISEKPTKISNYFNSCYISKANKFIATDGTIHICERTDMSMGIGSIENGVDENKIKKAYKEYFSIMNREECLNCWAGLFCPICIAQLVNNGKLVPPDQDRCEQIRIISGFHLKILVSLADRYKYIYDALEIYFHKTDNVSIDEFLNQYHNNIKI